MKISKKLGKENMKLIYLEDEKFASGMEDATNGFFIYQKSDGKKLPTRLLLLKERFDLISIGKENWDLMY